MRKEKENAATKCPVCEKVENQVSAGKNHSGSQRCICKECREYYNFEPKTREYPEEVREMAINAYYAGVSGRGVGKIFGISKANVYNWIKKASPIPKFNPKTLERDELYWFVGQKSTKETRKMPI